LMYGDDIDLSFKIKKAGYKVYYTNQSRVMHYAGKSTVSWKQALADVWIRDSIHRFLVKSRGRWYGRCYKVTMAAVAVVRLALITFVRLLATSASRRESLSCSFTKWKRLLQWALGWKGWAKKAGEQIGFAAGEW